MNGKKGRAETQPLIPASVASGVVNALIRDGPG